MQHIDDEALESYILGTLSLQVEDVEEHLLICEACQERMEGTAVLVASISAASSRLRHDAIRTRLRFRTAGT